MLKIAELKDAIRQAEKQNVEYVTIRSADGFMDVGSWNIEFDRGQTEENVLVLTPE